MALVEGAYPGPQGQIETFRQLALGKFRDLLLEVARDPAMLVWLDGRINFRLRPQENFGREIMDLFTFGIGNYSEQDVYAAARVFTGWNLRFVNSGRGVDDPGSYYEFFYNPTPPVEFFARGVNLDVAWLGGGQIRVSGNSFATPHISAISALILSKHPELTPFQLKSVLYLVATNVGGGP